MLAESGSVDGSEVDLSAVLLGDGLQVGGERLALLGGLGEDVGEGKAGLVDECQWIIIANCYDFNLLPCSRRRSQGQPRQ